MTGQRGPITRLRPYRKPKEAPPPPPVPLQPPAPLPPRAQELWDRHATHLMARQLLTEQSVSGYVELCLTYGELCEARERLTREGRTITNSKGDLVKNPLATQEKQLSDRLLAYLREYGLTGAAKKRLLDPGQEPRPFNDDPLGLDD
jgi:P27 family predicted phage terminase small subunit